MFLNIESNILTKTSRSKVTQRGKNPLNPKVVDRSISIFADTASQVILRMRSRRASLKPGAPISMHSEVVRLVLLLFFATMYMFEHIYRHIAT